MCLRCRLELSCLVRTLWLSTTSLQLVNNILPPHFQRDFSVRSLGGSARAAGDLIAKAGGKTAEYLFIIEIVFLNARSKLDAPAYSIVEVGEWTREGYGTG